MDTAFEWLMKGVDQHDGMSSWLAADPAFDIFRSDPRFAPLVRKRGFEPMPLPKAQ